MKRTRLARRLGLDGNPLRRRIDKIAACLAALLVAVFLIGAPMLSMAAARGRVTPRPPGSGPRAPGARCRPLAAGRAAARRRLGVSGYSWVPARWTAPDGHERAGRIPVSTGLAAGRTVRLWVDAAGSPTGPPSRMTSRSGQRSHSGCLCHRRAGRSAVVAGGGRPVGAWTGAGLRPGKRHGRLSAPSGPGASGREASRDDPARDHRAAARAVFL